MRRLLTVVILCCIVVSRLTSVAPLAQQPAPVSPSPVLDEQTSKEIFDLKRQALDAERAKDLKKAQALYKKVQDLDPTDAFARQQLQAIQTEINGVGEEEIKRLTTQARRKQIEELTDQAEQALIEAKTTNAKEALERALKLLGQARSSIQPTDRNVRNLQGRIDNLQGLIDQDVATRNVRFWELWGFIGLVVVGISVPLVVYFRRTGRVLEMVEGPQVGQVFVLQKEDTALGALASEVDWAIDDPLRKISRRHCDVLRQGRHYFLVDCSTNGTLLNGRPLQKGQPALLKRGDRIGLGGEVTLQFR